MLTLAMFFWIGLELGAPVWFWWVLGIYAFISIMQFGLDMFKHGRNS